MLGRWAICPHCGGEIDWRDVSSRSTGETIAIPNDITENER
jgi:predicted RNA-binding Zn-ribbon protein involved in translation (DUF1610 family)